MDRGAMGGILLRMMDIEGMKFFNVAPVEQLIDLLAHETPRLQRNITSNYADDALFFWLVTATAELLMPTFFAPSKDPTERFRRAINLIGVSQEAAVAFFGW